MPQNSQRTTHSSKVNNKKNKKRNTKEKYSNNCNNQKKNNMDKYTDSDDIGKSTPNDISWYAFDPALLRDSSNIPYSWPVGITVDLTNDVYTRVPVNTQDRHVPGIFTLDVMPGPGISTNAASPINIAAKNIYSFVRHANSGHSNYDSQDLMIYLLAMDEAIMWFYNCARAYGLINLYNNQNRYFPKHAVEAAGFDYTDLSSQMADFRYTLNAYLVRLASLCIPMGMPYFDRHAWLYSGIYMDGTSAKAQAYMYKPAGYRAYTETEPGGGKLVFKRFPAQEASPVRKTTLADIKAICDDIISPIIGSEDLNIMSGDILKAYGNENIRKFVTIPENYVVGPVYNEEVLSQFQNASINFIMGYKSDGNWDITQDPNINEGTVLYNPNIQSLLPSDNVQNAYLRTGKQIINLNLDTPTISDTMIASRLINILVPDEANEYYKLDSCGSEIIVGGDIWVANDTNLLIHERVGRQLPQFWSASDNTPIGHMTTLLNLLHLVSHWTRFKFAPQIDYSLTINYPNTGDDPSNAVSGYYPLIFKELDNYSVIDKDTLRNMHETALLSLFHVPQLAKASAYRS